MRFNLTRPCHDCPFRSDVEFFVVRTGKESHCASAPIAMARNGILVRNWRRWQMSTGMSGLPPGLG